MIKRVKVYVCQSADGKHVHIAPSGCDFATHIGQLNSKAITLVHGLFAIAMTEQEFREFEETEADLREFGSWYPHCAYLESEILRPWSERAIEGPQRGQDTHRLAKKKRRAEEKEAAKEAERAANFEKNVQRARNGS